MNDILEKIDFNGLINAANNSLYCDAECQRKKRETQLRERMNRAALLIEKAPENYEKAKKEYIEFLHGTNYYNEYKITEDTREFRESIRPLLKELNSRHEELREVAKNKQQLSKTQEILKNNKNKITHELGKINGKLEKIETTVETTKKREFYENDNKNHLKLFLRINNFIFYFLIVISVLYYYYVKNKISAFFIGVIISIVIYGLIVDYYTIK